MECAKPGHSGIEVSRICIGGMSFGEPGIELSKEEMDYLEEPYVAHELVGPIGRPGEKPMAGTVRPKATEEVREG